MPCIKNNTVTGSIENGVNCQCQLYRPKISSQMSAVNRNRFCYFSADFAGKFLALFFCELLDILRIFDAVQ